MTACLKLANKLRDDATASPSPSTSSTAEAAAPPREECSPSREARYSLLRAAVLRAAARLEAGGDAEPRNDASPNASPPLLRAAASPTAMPNPLPAAAASAPTAAPGSGRSAPSSIRKSSAVQPPSRAARFFLPSLACNRNDDDYVQVRRAHLPSYSSSHVPLPYPALSSPSLTFPRLPSPSHAFPRRPSPPLAFCRSRPCRRAT